MSYRTDLAIEVAEPFLDQLPNGVSQDEHQEGNLHISLVTIASPEAESMLGKPAGRYITVTAPPLYSSVPLSEEEINAVADQIRNLLPEEGLVLVVGLGNSDITPDAIGPRTAHGILATRHISGEVAQASGLGQLRPAAVIAPGVLGQTGMESSEVIHAIVKNTNPTAVVVVDALAARSAARLGTTIQIADSGISPGSGVMNRRKELSMQTLGVPVVSVGIPTVVDASTLAQDLLQDADSATQSDLFEPEGRSMMITPREIDQLIDHATQILSLSINKALHPQMTLEDISYLCS